LNTIYSDQQQVKNNNVSEIKSQEVALFKENTGGSKDVHKVKLEKINSVSENQKGALFSNVNNIGVSRSIDAMNFDPNSLVPNKFHSGDGGKYHGDTRSLQNRNQIRLN
jgi:hypothetical protein